MHLNLTIPVHYYIVNLHAYCEDDNERKFSVMIRINEINPDFKLDSNLVKWLSN